MRRAGIGHGPMGAGDRLVFSPAPRTRVLARGDGSHVSRSFIQKSPCSALTTAMKDVQGPIAAVLLRLGGAAIGAGLRPSPLLMARADRVAV